MQVTQGEVREVLAAMEAESVHMARKRIEAEPFPTVPLFGE